MASHHYRRFSRATSNCAAYRWSRRWKKTRSMLLFWSAIQKVRAGDEQQQYCIIISLSIPLFLSACIPVATYVRAPLACICMRLRVFAQLHDHVKSSVTPTPSCVSPAAFVPDEIAASTVPIGEWEFVQKYFKMLKVGLPRPVVEHKMSSEVRFGLDVSARFVYMRICLLLIAFIYSGPLPLQTLLTSICVDANAQESAR